MDFASPSLRDSAVIPSTREWGSWGSVSLYLKRCQVDTPFDLVKATWAHVFQLREKIGKVVDFGAGDARFSKAGHFKEYVGYEIDPTRCRKAVLPKNASLRMRCAFSDEIKDADLCIGNPPFVRNQDLPVGWREQASDVLRRRIGVTVSGLANAWQYFFLLSLASIKADGLCALVIPYEWVSRPSARKLREYIEQEKWNVRVYRLVDATFDSVLTTSSITIVDKANCNGEWQYFKENGDGQYTQLKSPSGGAKGVLRYIRRSEVSVGLPRAIRGLSPGTQEVLTLTEGERVRLGLRIGRDVVPCVTTLRHVPNNCKVLNEKSFQRYFRAPGNKCWLIRSDKSPSKQLSAYLKSVPEQAYSTSTCLERPIWWKFKMPAAPSVLMSQSFRKTPPKTLKNQLGAIAVGGVCGIFNIRPSQLSSLTSELVSLSINDRIVAHSNGLRKIEINQLNALICDVLGKRVRKEQGSMWQAKK